MRDGLVIARVGDKSLHPRWLDGARNWDLILSSFGSKPPARASECLLVEEVKGPKWAPLHDVITRNIDLVRRYRYVMLPDDDLLFSAADLNRFFELCREHNFAIAQPSLDYESFYSHPITVKRPLLSYRVTDFVEVMTPCFRLDVLEEILPTLLASSSGWGIDGMWHTMLEGRGERLAIVDEVSVTHTRPVGGELYRSGALKRSPVDDLQDLSASGAAQEGRRMAYGCTRSGVKVPRVLVRGLGLLARIHRRRDGHPVHG